MGRAQRGFRGPQRGFWGGSQGDGTLRNASPRDDTSGAGRGDRASVGMDGERYPWRDSTDRYIYIYKIDFYFIYIYIFEGIPREREAGLQQGRASGQAPAPSFDRFGPFFTWELPRCEASWLHPPHPKFPSRCWRAHLAGAPTTPKAMGQMVVPARRPPEQRLERCGASVHLSSHPHKTPRRRITPKKCGFLSFPHHIH